MRGITKRFGQVVANDSIDLTINKGEILALLGENGSGKTTLMNMLSGIYQPDEGEIFKEGERIFIRSPREAFEYGIGMIHQHYKLIEVFTAAQNIILGLDEGKMDLRKTNERVAEICGRYGFEIDLSKKVYDMSVSQKQTVEIVKVLYRGADILILDEPTAVLTPQETQKLFKVLMNMKKDGKAIIIITHKLHEVMEVSDKVAVLRKGKYIGTVNTSETNPQALTDMMVGHAVTLNIDRPLYPNPEKKLIVEGLTCIDDDGVKKLDNVSYRRLGLPRCAFFSSKKLLSALFLRTLSTRSNSSVGVICFFEESSENAHFQLRIFNKKISSCCSLVTFFVHILSNFVHFLTYFVHFSPKLRNYSVESPQPSIYNVASDGTNALSFRF